MEIYCIEEFKNEYDKLKKKKSYNTIEKDIIDYFIGKNSSDLCSGTRLNNSEHEPYIKTRINGSGGFRVYFLLLIKKEKLYLMFVHPKTGSMGAENITDESKTKLYKKVLKGIKTQSLYEINEEKNKLIFKKLDK
ncbi:hypothetical protein GF357_03155 [Candidatus Dojkabacteria bacterium]|nr:hypothetical protein [Candidatus Dojkabacteria bacterium]